MSYINQALRKAQEAKGNIYTPYRQFIETGAGRSGQVNGKVFRWLGCAAALLLVAVSLIALGQWAPFFGDKMSVPAPPKEAIVAAPPPSAPASPEESAEVKALFEKAITAQRLLRFAEAEKIYGQILAVLPNHKKSLNNLGILYLDKGNDAQARHFLEQAKAADAAWADPHYNLACLLGRGGRPQEALVHLQRAAALSPAVLEWAMTDDDLRSIRLLPEFQKLKEALAK